MNISQDGKVAHATVINIALHKKNRDNFRVCGRRPCVQNAILKAARADYGADLCMR